MERRCPIAACLLVSCLALSCAPPPSGEAGAESSAGAEHAAGLPPPPPPAGPTAAAAVPPTQANTPEAAAVVPVADPVTASPSVYKVVLESPRMRILEGSWKPKQKDAPHGHPPLVAYALTDVDALSHGDDSEPIAIKLKAGQAFFQNALHAHAFENVGRKVARILIVELKQGVDSEPLPEDASPDALTASPDVYRKVFEDQHVRVLYASWEPGKMDEMHGHPGLAGYYLTDISAKLHERFGQSEDISQQAGTALFHAAVRGHTFENTGKATARMVLFEPKAPAFGGAGTASSAGGTQLPTEEGKGEVSSYVDPKTGVRMDIGEGFTADILPGTRFLRVVTFSKTEERPSPSGIAPGFSRHAATLVFDGKGKNLAQPVVIGIGIPRMPVRTGQKFVLAMESSGECTKENKRFTLRDGGCSVWTIVPAELDEARKKVVGRLPATGGFRLQFGWMPE